MLGDNERSGVYASEQRRLVRASVAAEVLTFTPYWREAAADAGLRRPTAVADLRGLRPRPLPEVGPPDSLVLRPSPDAVRKRGPRPLRRRLRRARLRHGRAGSARLVLDPLYTPLHWLLEDRTPVGCSEADLVRLAELGRRSLDLAGVTRNDAIVSLVPPGPTLSSWQLVLGAREAGIPHAGLEPSASVDAVTLLGPTVLAGQPADLRRVLDGLASGVRASIATVLVVTREPLHRAERARLEKAAGSQAALVEMWAPPGVRALWTQCRSGDGVHTWPQSELLEVCEPDGEPVAAGEEGELVWTGLGWRGTVLIRLATGVRGRVVDGRCDACGRTTPRILDARLAGRAAAVPEEPEPLVSPAKPTGGVESVRTLRPARRRSTPARSAPAEAPTEPAAAGAGNGSGTTGNGAPDPVRRAQEAPPEDPPGVVRAVAKEEPARPAPAPARAPARSAIGDTDHLPPVPGVGPDAAGADEEDDAPERWLPDTGEVDAWPAPVLASTDGLAAWQVEHRRRRGHDELVVHLALAEGAELGEVLVSLERSIGATQYVVGGETDIAARVAAADGRRVVDRRSRSSNGASGRRPVAPGTARDR